jgi:hypothetical protein
MVICYSESENIKQLFENATDLQVSLVNSQENLASAIVEGSHPVGVFIQLEELNERWSGFISSLKKCYPLLALYLILPEEQIAVAEKAGYQAFGLNDESLPDKVTRELVSVHDQNKRKHPRFDWPLMGKLDLPGRSQEKFRVRSISSGGAFMESEDYFPEVDSRGTVVITFHDFNLLSGCRITGKRPISKNFPSGFGVEFTDLTPTSIEIIEQMVADELLRTLLDPDKPARPPSISG